MVVVLRGLVIPRGARDLLLTFTSATYPTLHLHELTLDRYGDLLRGVRRGSTTLFARLSSATQSINRSPSSGMIHSDTGRAHTTFVRKRPSPTGVTVALPSMPTTLCRYLVPPSSTFTDRTRIPARTKRWRSSFH